MTSTRDVDVLVVGGGPAGLSTAHAAADAGLDVLVVERCAGIGEPVHTSGGTSPAAMRSLGIPGELLHPLPRLRVASAGAEAVFEYDEPVFGVLDVRETYRFLAREAERAGARVETGVAARRPLLDGACVVGCTVARGGVESEVRASVVVDASGYRASIARRAGLHAGFRRFGVGSEVELRTPAVRQDEALIVVGDVAPAGYGWVFPWGGDRVRVGVGVHHVDVRDDPDVLLEQLLPRLVAFGVECGDARVVERHFGLVPAEPLARRLVADGLVAVGDAASQATLVAGEGIRVAIVAGRMAGEVVAAAAAQGRSDRSALAPYERRFRREFGRRLAVGDALNRRIARYDEAAWAARIAAARALPRDAVAQLLFCDVGWGTAARLARRPRTAYRVARALAWRS